MRTKAMESQMKVKGQIAIDNNKGAIYMRLKLLELNGNYVEQLEKQQAKEQEQEANAV